MSPPGDGASPPGDGPPAGQVVNPGQLAGFTVVLTSDRRSDEFAQSFTRRRANVLRAPILRILPLVEDVDLHAATVRVIAAPPDAVVVTTAIGLRGWVEAADAFGLATELLAALHAARLLARGPKARGAIRAVGLAEEWAAESETTGEVVDRLLADGVRGKRVVLQLHGLPDRDSAEPLVAAGAILDTVQVYRWGPSPDPTAVGRAIDAVCARTADAVLFTSAPGSQPERPPPRPRRVAVHQRAGEPGLPRCRRDLPAGRGTAPGAGG